MKSVAGISAFSLGLSVAMASAASAEPPQTPDDAAAATAHASAPAPAHASADRLRGKRCMNKREFRRIKVAGKWRHRSSVRQVRRIVGYNGRRKYVVRSGGAKWEIRKYRQCRKKRSHVFVNYKNNRAYAKNKPNTKP